MTSQNNQSRLGSVKNTEIADSFLNVQANLLYKLTKVELSDRANELKALLYAVHYNAKSISILGRQGLLNDCVVLSRAFVERLVNFCYLMVCEDEEFENFKLHLHQKTFRRLDRETQVGNKKLRIAYSGIDEIRKLPGVEEGLKKFTSEKGKEKTHWTKTTIEQRLEKIENKSKINVPILMLSYLSIYENASEALHGTMYGAMFHYGILHPGNNVLEQDNLNEHVRRELTLLFWQHGQKIHELIAMANEVKSSEELQDILKQSNENCLLMLKDMKFALA